MLHVVSTAENVYSHCTDRVELLCFDVLLQITVVRQTQAAILKSFTSGSMS